MKVCLILPTLSNLDYVTYDQPLGLLYLGAVLEEKGVDVEVLDLNFYNNWREELAKHDADVYGVYCSSPLLNSVIEISNFIKKTFPNKIRIVGGPHPTSLPEPMKEYFDVVVKGEGERVIIQIIEDIENNKLKSFYHVDYIEDLDSIPYPARHLLPIKKYQRLIDGEKSTGLLTARGCPYECVFCDKNIWGRKTRFRSAENIFGEIRSVKNEYNIRAFNIVDDTFTLKRSRLFGILKGFKKLDIVWRCLTRVNHINLKILEKMKESGCVEIVFGIESGSQKVLDALNKGVTVKENAKAIDLAKKVGILSKAAFIVGSPNQDFSTLQETMSFIEKHTPNKVQLCVFTPHPGSLAWEEPEKLGIKLLTRDVSRFQAVAKDMTGKVVIETNKMSKEDINQAHKNLLTFFKKLGLSPY